VTTLHPPAAPVVESWTDGRAWDDFVAKAPDGNVGHRWAWMRVVPAAYGHKVIPLAAIRDGAVAGVLPLALLRSRVFGRHLVSMPYLDYGGLCTAGDRVAEEALVAAAVELASANGAKLELRHLGDRPIGLPAALHKVTMTLDLGGGEDAVWKRIRSNRRAQVRKAQRNGLRAGVHGAEGLDDFYRIIGTNMRDLGSPVHRRRFFERAIAELGQDARIVVVRDGDQAVGAGMVLVHGDQIAMPWPSSLRSSFARGSNQLLYWEVLRYGIERGCREFDFGRSSKDKGTFEWKRQWGAEQVQLFWHRDPPQEADEDQQRLEWATRLWRRFPVGMANVVGPLVRGGLPN
jgi:FemAB-related protein (PEP-CTERM system-associated)